MMIRWKRPDPFDAVVLVHLALGTAALGAIMGQWLTVGLALLAVDAVSVFALAAYFAFVEQDEAP